MTITPELEAKWLQVIYEGLEGEWIYKGVEADGHILDFAKPEIIGDMADVKESFPTDVLLRTMQYRIVIAPNNIVWLILFIKTANQEVSYKILIDYMHSFNGYLNMVDHLGNPLEYVRLEPRKMG